MQKNKPILLLWTGGWDSTFRLLQLVLMEKRAVQPVYLVNYRRMSLDREWQVMNRIRRLVLQRDPGAKNRLLPTIYFHKFFLRHDVRISRQFKNLESYIDIGLQYKWFALLSRQYKLDAFELGFIRVEEGSTMTINRRLRELSYGEGEHRQLDPSRDLGDMEIFRSFRLPIFDLSKTDIARIAAENGFYDILSLTWFCLHPLPNGLPCKECRPCTLAEKNRMVNWSDQEIHPFSRKLSKFSLVLLLAMIHLISNPGRRLQRINAGVS